MMFFRVRKFISVDKFKSTLCLIKLNQKKHMQSDLLVAITCFCICDLSP